MQIHVKYFASVREAMGQGGETLHTATTTVGTLRDELVARGGPGGEMLARDKAVRVALNQTMCDESTLLTDGAELAFFPPVTGG